LERLRGPVEIPAYAPWQIALATALVILCVGLLLWLVFRTRRKSKPSIAPYTAAIHELDAAAELTAEDDDRFAVLSSLALRRYLENTLGLRFSTHTSEEFLRSLKGDTRFDAEFHRKLGEVLTAFDRVKFAGQQIERDTRIQLTDTVRALIDQVEQTQQKEDATK
jgi:hypothetical protein